MSRFRIAVTGARGSGKTAYITRYTTGEFHAAGGVQTDSPVGWLALFDSSVGPLSIEFVEYQADVHPAETCRVLGCDGVLYFWEREEDVNATDIALEYFRRIVPDVPFIGCLAFSDLGYFFPKGGCTLSNSTLAGHSAPLLVLLREILKNPQLVITSRQWPVPVAAGPPAEPEAKHGPPAEPMAERDPPASTAAEVLALTVREVKSFMGRCAKCRDRTSKCQTCQIVENAGGINPLVWVAQRNANSEKLKKLLQSQTAFEKRHKARQARLLERQAANRNIQEKSYAIRSSQIAERVEMARATAALVQSRLNAYLALRKAVCDSEPAAAPAEAFRVALASFTAPQRSARTTRRGV